MFHVEHPTGFSVEIGLEFPIYGDGDGWKRGHFSTGGCFDSRDFCRLFFSPEVLGPQGLSPLPGEF
jgi:hypothetical protein